MQLWLRKGARHRPGQQVVQYYYTFNLFHCKARSSIANSYGCRPGVAGMSTLMRPSRLAERKNIDAVAVAPC